MQNVIPEHASLRSVTMPRFAVYYVPPEDKFYRLGSQIVGYDIRACEPVTLGDDWKDLRDNFDEKWVEHARPFGFHLTISDAISFEGKIKDMKKEIEPEIESVLDCFNPDHQFKLTRRKDDFVTFWQKKGGEAVVLRYDPNNYLKLLSALIVSRVNPLGTGSGYLKRYKSGSTAYRLHQVHRIRTFYSPYVFDDYSPHFTLLDPYTGNDHHRLTQIFSEKFQPFSHITVDTICLLFQKEKDKKWEICREFNVNSFPRPLSTQ